MAQQKPFTWYQQGMAPGFPGMKANATADVVDSFACEGGVNPGEPVVRGTDPEHQAKKAAVSGKPIGIALHIHKEPPASDTEAYFPDGYSLSILTSGDVYVTAGGDVAVGDPVAYDLANGYIKGTETTPSGNMFMESGAKGDIVRIRVRNAAVIAVSDTSSSDDDG